MRQKFTISRAKYIHCPGWKSYVHFFFDKEASNNNPGALILFEGHPDYFTMALNEILFLKVVFPRPLHPNDLECHELEVTPMPRMGLRTTNSQDRPKKWHIFSSYIKCTLKLKHTFKSFSERRMEKCERYTTPVLISTCLVCSLLPDVNSLQGSWLRHTMLGDCSRRKLQLNGAEVSLGWIQIPLVSCLQTFTTPLKVNQDLGQFKMMA